MDNRLRQSIRRKLDYSDARIRARLATDSTGPYATRAGYMRVEVQKSATEFLPAVEARNDTSAHLAGTFVNVIEEDGELVIYRVDSSQEIARGANPMVTGGQNQDAFSYITTEQLNDFRTIETAPPGAEVFIMPGFLADGTYFPGALTTTLATLVSGLATGEHMLVCTFIKPNGTVEVQNSTAQNQLDPFDSTDLAECISMATSGAIPSKAIRLYAGQTTVAKEDFQYDIRQHFNGLGGEASLGNPNPIVRPVNTGSNRQVLYYSELIISDGGALSIGSGSDVVILPTSLSREARVVTEDATLTDSDYIVLVNASTGAVTVTLPTAVHRAGRKYIVKKTDSTAYRVTIDADGSETIDGDLTQSIDYPYTALQLVSDNSNWWII